MNFVWPDAQKCFEDVLRRGDKFLMKAVWQRAGMLFSDGWVYVAMCCLHKLFGALVRSQIYGLCDAEYRADRGPRQGYVTMTLAEPLKQVEYGVNGLSVQAGSSATALRPPLRLLEAKLEIDQSCLFTSIEYKLDDLDMPKQVYSLLPSCLPRVTPRDCSSDHIWQACYNACAQLVRQAQESSDQIGQPDLAEIYDRFGGEQILGRQNVAHELSESAEELLVVQIHGMSR